MTNKENKLSQGTRVWLRDGNGEKVYGHIRAVNESTQKCSVGADDGRIFRGIHNTRVFLDDRGRVFDINGVHDMNEGVFSDAVDKVKNFAKKFIKKVVKMVSGKKFAVDPDDESKIVPAVTLENIIVDLNDGDIPGGVKGCGIHEVVSGKTFGDTKVFEERKSTEAQAKAYVKYYAMKLKGMKDEMNPEELNIVAEQVFIDTLYDVGAINESEQERRIKDVYESRRIKKALRERRINEAKESPTSQTENLDFPNIYGVQGLHSYLIPYFEGYLRRGNSNIENDPLWDYDKVFLDGIRKKKEANREVLTQEEIDDIKKNNLLTSQNIAGGKNPGLQTIPMIWGLPGTGKTGITKGIRLIIQDWIQKNKELFPPVKVNGVEKERTYGIIEMDLSQRTAESLSVLTIAEKPSTYIDDEGFEQKYDGLITQEAQSVPISTFPMFNFTEGTKEQMLRKNDLANRGNDRTGCGGILFFDELSRARRDVLNVCMKFFQTRELDGRYRLGTQWAMVGAGNRIIDGVKTDWDTAMYDRFIHFNYVPDTDECVKFIRDQYEEAGEDVPPEMELVLQSASTGNSRFLFGVIGDENVAMENAKKRHEHKQIAEDPLEKGTVRPASIRNFSDYGVWRNVLIKSDIYQDLYGKPALTNRSTEELKGGLLTDEEFEEYVEKVKELTNATRGFDAAEFIAQGLRQYRQFSESKFKAGLNNTSLIKFFQKSIYTIDRRLKGKTEDEYTDDEREAVTLYENGEFVEVSSENIPKLYDMFFDVENEKSKYHKNTHYLLSNERSVLSFTPLSEYLVKPIIDGLEREVSVGGGRTEKKTLPFSGMHKIVVGDEGDSKAKEYSFSADTLGISSDNIQAAAYTALVAILKENGIKFKLDVSKVDGVDPFGKLKDQISDSVGKEYSITDRFKNVASVENDKKLNDIDDVISPIQWFNLVCLASSMSNKQQASVFISDVLSGIVSVCLILGLAPSASILDSEKLEKGQKSITKFADTKWALTPLMCVPTTYDDNYKNLWKEKERRKITEVPIPDMDARIETGVIKGYLAGAILLNGIFGQNIKERDDFMQHVTDGTIVEEVISNILDANIAVKE